MTEQAEQAEQIGPPSSEEIDAVIETFRSKAGVAAHQGASTAPFWAVIAAIEWTLGRPSTAEWVPGYVFCAFDEYVSCTFDKVVRPTQADSVTQATDAVFEKTMETWIPARVKTTIVTGCRADCANTRHYIPSEGGMTLGCPYNYGTLPQEGFAPWCPLKDKD